MINGKPATNANVIQTVTINGVTTKTVNGVDCTAGLTSPEAVAQANQPNSNAFDCYDKDENQKINGDELKKMGIDLQSAGLSGQDFSSITSNDDLDKDGALSRTEFRRVIVHIAIRIH